MTALLTIIVPLLFGPPADRSGPDIVEVTIPRVSVEPGDSSMIVIGVRVKEGYHIQSGNPGDEYLIPTTLEIHSKRGITIGRPVIPPGHIVILAEKRWDVLAGDFLIRAVVNAEEVSLQGEEFLHATLRYQPCDEKRCFAPQSLEFVIPLTIKPRPAGD